MKVLVKTAVALFPLTVLVSTLVNPLNSGPVNQNSILLNLTLSVAEQVNVTNSLHTSQDTQPFKIGRNATLR